MIQSSLGHCYRPVVEDFVVKWVCPLKCHNAKGYDDRLREPYSNPELSVVRHDAFEPEDNYNPLTIILDNKLFGAWHMQSEKAPTVSLLSEKLLSFKVCTTLCSTDVLFSLNCTLHHICYNCFIFWTFSSPTTPTLISPSSPPCRALASGWHPGCQVVGRRSGPEGPPSCTRGWWCILQGSGP